MLRDVHPVPDTFELTFLSPYNLTLLLQYSLPGVTILKTPFPTHLSVF